MPGVTAQRPTQLYWWPGRAPDLEIGRIARLLEPDAINRIDSPSRAPAPVLQTDAPIVVVAGQGIPSP